MRRLDFLASQTHWADHLAPVWNALPEEARGEFYTNDPEYCATLGVKARTVPRRPMFEMWVVAASASDINRAYGRRIVRFEHGAGFSFSGGHARNNPSYPGGSRQRGVRAFLNPNRFSSDRWLANYPLVPSLIVGVPKMDPYHLAPPKPRGPMPIVALTFHWDCMVCPETRSAYSQFAVPAMAALAARTDIKPIAHAHPRIGKKLRRLAEEHGVEWVERIEEVFERADVMLNDASSVLYEFASLDRPVVVMNATYYNRRRQHGLRFWEHSQIGPNVNADPTTCVATEADILRGVYEALEDPPEFQNARAQMIDDVYPYRGAASQRAVEALMEVTQ